MAFKSLFGTLKRPQLIGMIHLRPLPGTPFQTDTLGDVMNKALEEAELLKANDVDGIIVENMHDIPYVQGSRIGPEIVSSMAVICREVRKVFSADKPVGVQILAGANIEAMAVAQASGLQFIRAESYVFSHVADEGLMSEASAGPLLRYRKQIGADSVAVITDIKKKHSAHVITQDVSIKEMANAAEFFAADGVILTGSSTGSSANPQELADVISAVKKAAVIIGSGITPENAENFKAADAFIVGSYLKHNGDWKNDIDPARVMKICQAVSLLKRA